MRDIFFTAIDSGGWRTRLSQAGVANGSIVANSSKHRPVKQANLIRQTMAEREASSADGVSDFAVLSPLFSYGAQRCVSIDQRAEASK
jgi:hypothetical protein